jgi:hypothetical protein
MIVVIIIYLVGCVLAYGRILGSIYPVYRENMLGAIMGEQEKEDFNNLLWLSIFWISLLSYITFISFVFLYFIYGEEYFFKWKL